MPGKNRAATSPDYCVAETPRAGWPGGIAVLQVLATVQRLLMQLGIADRDTAVDQDASTASDRRRLGQATKRANYSVLSNILLVLVS